jgi:hypothetical protein
MTGIFAFISFWMMSRMAVSRPPGVSILMMMADLFVASASSIFSMT